MASEPPRRLAAGALFIVYLAFGPTAGAQTASDRETARALMDEGFAKRERGDHRGALERFEAADALMHVPTTGLETARERVAVGRLIEARELLGQVVRYAARPGEPPPFAEARMHAQRLDDDLGARIPQLRVVLRGADATVTVTIDGVEVPTASLVAARRIDPGAHTIVARAGTRERKERVTLRERETKELVLELPPPAIAASSPATSGDAGAQGDAREPAPAKTQYDPSPVPRALFWGGLATAGVGLVVGSITGAMSLSAVGAAKLGCNGTQCPPDTYDDISRARSLGNVSTVAFIIGGAGGALAVAGFLLEKRETKQVGRVTPFVGVGAAGVRGTF